MVVQWCCCPTRFACSKVDGLVPRIQHVNLRKAREPGCSTGYDPELFLALKLTNLYREFSMSTEGESVNPGGSTGHAPELFLALKLTNSYRELSMSS